MRNKKGFTLVELLVVLVIIGIITALAIPLIRNIRQANELRQYKAYLESVNYSAKLYNDSYSEDLFGHNKAGCAYVTYSQLEEKDLIKDIQIKDTSCASDDTFVKVIKLGDKYSYFSHISCGLKSNDSYAPSVNMPEGQTKDETCSLDAVLKMNIKGNPEKSTAVSYKKRNVKVEISSSTGINNKVEIYYGFSKSNSSYSDITSWEKLAFENIPSEKDQKETLLSEDNSIEKNIKITSQEVTTPTGVTGDYYLVLRVENLKDLVGQNWTTEDEKYVYLGPYRVDNEKPKFNDSTILSTESDYNSLTPKLNLKVTDNYTKEADLKMCVSFDTDSCKKTASELSKYEKYSKNKVLDKISTKYDGSEHKIYITVVDKAGNYETKEYSYKVALKYKITYNSNEGNACSPTSKEVVAGNKWGDLCTPTRTGYTFTGWNTKQDGSGTTITKDSTASSNITVYAQWRINKIHFKIKIQSGESLTTSTTSTDGKNYTWGKTSSNVLTRSVNSGTASEYSLDINYGATTLDLPNYNNSRYIKITKTGYTGTSGAEWICESGCKTSGMKFSQDNTTIDSSKICDASKSDCTVYLKVNWRVNVCTITYHPNGGTFTSNATDTVQTCNYNGSNNCTNDMRNASGGYYSATRTGYSIVSGKEWINGSTTYNQANGYKATDFCPNLGSGDQSVTLKVNWSINTYKLTYDSNGGGACNPGSISKEYNTAWGTLCSPTRTGYKFAGWNTKSDGSGTTITSTSKATSSLTVYAKWTPNVCTITYHPNGGTFTSNATDTVQTCNYNGSNNCTNDMRNASGGYYSATRTGYSIVSGKEWINGSKTYNQANGYKATDFCPNLGSGDQNVTLKVNWQANTYTISYQLNSGTGTMTPTSYTYGVGATINGKPTRSGYTFNGWSTASSLTSPAFSKTISKTDTGNKTFYAKWCQNCASVSNGSCSLNASTAGTCTYTTSCNAGYTISGNGTRNPTCTLTIPSKPTVTFYLWKDNSTTPSSASGLSSYTTSTNKWSNKYIISIPSGGGSYVDHYEYTTAGTTTKDTNKKASYRNINTNGTSTIKWRACNSSGSCSDYTDAYTINIDTIKPTCSFTKTDGDYVRGNKINLTGADTGGSGLKSTQYKAGSGDLTDYTSSVKSSANCSTEITYTGKVTDNAGNSATCSQKFLPSHLYNETRSVYYQFIENALKYATTNSTIKTLCTLYEDPTEATISGGKTITLQIQNGHTLKVNGNNGNWTNGTIEVIENSTLKLNGQGTLSSSYPQRVVYVKYGNLIFENGKITKNLTSDSGACLKVARGTIEMKSGTLECSSEGISAENHIKVATTIKVTGGTIKRTNSNGKQNIVCANASGSGEIKTSLTVTSNVILIHPASHYLGYEEHCNKLTYNPTKRTS